MDIVVKVVQLILCLSLLVFVHELGHFMFAKLFKTRVEKFYLFFNPWFSLLKFKIRETEYGIGWVPFGGYVKIAGMIDESMDKEQMKQPPQPYEFRSKPAWQRLLIMTGGVIMNILTAFVIYVCMSWHYGESYIADKDVPDGYAYGELAQEIGFRDGDRIVSVRGKTYDNFMDMQRDIIIGGEGTIVVEQNGERREITITEAHIPRLLNNDSWFMTLRMPFVIDSVVPEQAAARAGLQPGDSLTALNSVPMRYRDEYVRAFKTYAGDSVQAAFVRNGMEETLTIVIPDSSRIGVYNKINFPDLYPISRKQYTLWEAIPQGFHRAGEQLSSYLQQLKLIVNPQTEAYKQVGSVVAMGNFFPASFDAYVFWNITALFSIMLAVMNILPIPALDGGHVMFLLYEVITRRKPSDKFMEYAQTVGMFLLLGLMLLAFGNDIFRLFR